MPDAYIVDLPNGFTISDDRARLDMGFVHAMLRTAYWATGRSREQTDRCWRHCLPFGVYRSDGSLVGFARVLTDYTFRAHLGDVLITEAVRGQGLGKALVSAVLAHPELAMVEKWTLTTGDAHGLYARHGFQLGERDGRWMVMERAPG